MAGLKFRIFGGADDEISASAPKARIGDAPTATAPKIPLEKKVRRFITGTTLSLFQFTLRRQERLPRCCRPDDSWTVQRGPWVISRSPGSTCFFGAKLKSRAVRQPNHGRLWSRKVDVRHASHVPSCEGNKGLRCAERAKCYRPKRNAGFFMLSSGWQSCESLMDRLVPKRGLEPPRPDGHYTLNVARLPIPPLRHDWY